MVHVHTLLEWGVCKKWKEAEPLREVTSVNVRHATWVARSGGNRSGASFTLSPRTGRSARIGGHSGARAKRTRLCGIMPATPDAEPARYTHTHTHTHTLTHTHTHTHTHKHTHTHRYRTSFFLLFEKTANNNNCYWGGEDSWTRRAMRRCSLVSFLRTKLFQRFVFFFYFFYIQHPCSPGQWSLPLVLRKVCFFRTKLFPGLSFPD